MQIRTPKVSGSSSLYKVSFYIDNSMLNDDYRTTTIGEIRKARFAYYSDCGKEYTFFERLHENGRDRFSVDFKADKYDNNPQGYLDELNAKLGTIEKTKDNYGHDQYILHHWFYTFDKAEADKMSAKAKELQDKTAIMSVEELCRKLNADPMLKDKYRVSDGIRNGIGEDFGKGILQDSKWGSSIAITTNEEKGLYTIKSAGWHSYAFRNEKTLLACLYGFYDGGESVESRRWDYSYRVF